MRRVILIIFLAGCSNAPLKDVVVQGRALLRDPVAGQVVDSAWQTRRAQFLANADSVAPEGS
jgi:hypothetical protein